MCTIRNRIIIKIGKEKIEIKNKNKIKKQRPIILPPILLSTPPEMLEHVEFFDVNFILVGLAS